jgi:hypothetical protein
MCAYLPLLISVSFKKKDELGIEGDGDSMMDTNSSSTIPIAL